MADFIVLSGSNRKLLVDFHKMVNRELVTESFAEELDGQLGSLPFYGNLSVLIKETPELENFRTRIYDNFSRYYKNILYLPEVDMLIIKLPDKVTSSRTK